MDRFNTVLFLSSVMSGGEISGTLIALIIAVNRVEVIINYVSLECKNDFNHPFLFISNHTERNKYLLN